MDTKHLTRAGKQHEVGQQAHASRPGNTRRVLKTVVTVVSILIVLGGLGMAIWWASPSPDDFGTMRQMRDHLVKSLEAPGLTVRPVSDHFTSYRLGLNPLFALMFRSGELDLFMRSWESQRLAAASVSQFEIGTGSGRYFDFTFMLRAKPEWAAPVFHGDALMALPGVTGALYMDFYDPAGTIDLAAFFGPRADRLKAARARVDAWWNRGNFGKLTPHLDPWKSSWRVELHEPKNATPEQRKAYFAAAMEIYPTYLAVYLESLAALTGTLDAVATEKNRQGIRNFVRTLYEKDVAVAMGRMLFPAADFDAYLLDGFWGTGTEGVKPAAAD